MGEEEEKKAVRTMRKWSSLKPRVVSAGAPTRTPPGFNAEVSPSTAFLFRVMEVLSQIVCIFAPLNPYSKINWYGQNICVYVAGALY